MALRFICRLSYSVCLLAVCGCKLLDGAQEANYLTMEADPRHDTRLAEEEHAKALKIIDRHWAGNRTHADLADAEKHLQEALVADVTYGPAHNTLGTLYSWQQNHYWAAWEYEYAVKLMPEEMEPLYNLGLVYESAGKLDRAIVYFEMAHSLEPQSARVLGSLAKARMKNGETLNDVRYLLQKLLFHDTRPDWVAWARDQLGLNPEKTDQKESLPTQEDSDSDPLPLSIPPQPDTPVENDAPDRVPQTSSTKKPEWYSSDVPVDEGRKITIPVLPARDPTLFQLDDMDNSNP